MPRVGDDARMGERRDREDLALHIACIGSSADARSISAALITNTMQGCESSNPLGLEIQTNLVVNLTQYGYDDAPRHGADGSIRSGC